MVCVLTFKHHAPLAMKFYISLVLTFLVAFVSAQDTIPGSFTVQNHGADYPQKGNYIFGERSKSADAKFIKDNRYLKVDGNRSYNGIMVYAISRTTLQYHSLKGDYSKHSLDNGISNRNGEHRFNWMITESEVDGAIVDSFVKFMTTIPEDHLVFMYSGYYHSIPTMSEKFYEAIERFGSKEIVASRLVEYGPL